MNIETIRINKTGRDQLSKLKARTGITQWNVLCRWGFCISLTESGRPRPPKGGDRPVEMTWKTFGGEYADIYLALIKQRCVQDELELTEPTVTEELHAHIHRGIAYLAGDPQLKSIEDLIARAQGAPNDDHATAAGIH